MDAETGPDINQMAAATAPHCIVRLKIVAPLRPPYERETHCGTSCLFIIQNFLTLNV
jgi:hypothetical protein